MMRVSLVRWGLAVAALSLAPSAHARCSMPAGPAERICATPALAKLDADLVVREKAVLAVTARPATWTARIAEFRSWLAIAKDFDDKPFTPEALAGHLTDQIDILDREIARTRSVKPTATEADILGARCQTSWYLPNCTAPMAGILRDPDGTQILWQLQSGASEADGVGMGTMLWDASGKVPQLIGYGFEGAWMESPAYDPERQLLWAKGYMSGTGSQNADLLFQRRGGKWVEIDIESWRTALDARLPKGIEAWKGVDFDLTSLAATTDLWRADKDANCCPTGGRANLDFEISGDRLVLKGIFAQLGGPAEAWKDF